jgi:glycosyltransferase involved in cell wall biosynthesis
MYRLTAKPKITVEISPLFEDQWTGIPVFTRRLIQSLLRDGRVDVDYAYQSARFPDRPVLQALRLGTGTFLREDFEHNGPLTYSLVDRNSHFLYPSSKGLTHISPHEASTVHDLSTLFMPEHHEQANVSHHLDHFEAELRTDEVIFCITEATRAALVSAYPSVAAKTRLLYQYVDWPESFAEIERNLPPLRLGRYAVVVGTIEPRKNLSVLIRALPLPEVAGSDLKFLVIGRKGWLVDSFLEGLTDAVRKRLLFSGFVSEFTKYRLIKGAEFLVFPSLYEGFGIPALEAMSLGKPVLGARTSSLPEVIGDAGVYFDPLSATEFAAAFAEISNPDRNSELVPHALARHAAFDSRQMARPVVEWAMG